MEFVNLERFKKFLDDWSKYKIDDYTLKLYLDDVEKQYSETGSNYFEIPSHESVDGSPHTYYFDVENREYPVIDIIVIVF